MHDRFIAEHPGVFMYHCATQPVLLHTSAGMIGHVRRQAAGTWRRSTSELWTTQQEFYIGKPGKPADMAKMTAKTPDVIAFNGYADQYKDAARSRVRKGETIRMYVLDAGPSNWSAFHVIGTVVRQGHVEQRVARDVQTIYTRAPAKAAGSSSRSPRRATIRSSPTRSATWSRARSEILKTPHAAGGHGH